MDRRRFMGLSGSLIALGATASRASASPQPPWKPYQRAALVDGEGRPLRAATLRERESYVFFYPYGGTPSLLLNLGRQIEGLSLKTAKGTSYDWPGGTGANRSIVAFVAICSHQLTRIAREASFLNYNPAAGKISGAPGFITCCAHGSVYDPRKGAKVVFGPSPPPLTAVALEYDEGTDTLAAVGTYGGEMFRDFFKAYKSELRREFGGSQAKQEVYGQARVWHISEYTKLQVLC